jgi:DNA-3-methyladenine glycosylase
VLFGAPGIAYVYRSYGVHALLNAVSEPAGEGAAVLIRALEPLDGVDLMRERRGVERERDLCSGPGKLTQALGIGLELNDTPLDGPISIHPRLSAEPLSSVACERIGITRAVELPWRFCEVGSRYLSRPAPRDRGLLDGG